MPDGNVILDNFDSDSLAVSRIEELADSVANESTGIMEHFFVTRGEERESIHRLLPFKYLLQEDGDHVFCCPKTFFQFLLALEPSGGNFLPIDIYRIGGLPAPCTGQSKRRRRNG